MSTLATLAESALAQNLTALAHLASMEDMTTPAELGPLMTVDEVAAAFRVDRSVIYKEVKAGRIEAMRVGPRRGAIRIRESAFNEYVATCAIAAQAA